MPVKPKTKKTARKQRVRKTRVRKTRVRKQNGSNILHVDSLGKVPMLEKLLTNGSNLTFVYYKRASCPACQRFDPIWGEACKGKSRHNKVVINEDMLGSTSLSNANINSLPSLIAVSPKGEAVEFNGPEGPKDAMKTPVNVEQLRRVLNVNVPAPNPNAIANSVNQIVAPQNVSQNNNSQNNNSQNNNSQNNNSQNNNSQIEDTDGDTDEDTDGDTDEDTDGDAGTVNVQKLAMTVEPITQNKPTPFGTPSGKVFTPTPQIAPKSGGGIFSTQTLSAFKNLLSGGRQTRNPRKHEHRRLGRTFKPGKKTRSNRHTAKY